MERLDLEDNGIEGEGAMFIADMLRENIFITHVVSHSRIFKSVNGCFCQLSF